jgi:hypothetical protein
MQLKDFYFADRHAVGSRMAIMLPDGTDSGEWLQVRGPDCDESVQAGRAYTAALRAIDAGLEDIEAECKAKEDYTVWNERRSYLIEDINNNSLPRLLPAGPSPKITVVLRSLAQRLCSNC